MHTPPTPPPALRAALRRRFRRALGLLVGAALVVLPTMIPEPAPALSGRPNGPLVPDAGFYVGAYSKHVDGSGFTRQKEAVESLERELGRRLHIDHHFYEWEKEFPSEREPWDIENGRIPMISWNGTFSSQIINGSQDGLILRRAQDVKALGAPVFIRWMWEMDGNKKADRVEGPAKYVQAWKHIVDLFRAQGVNNAVWVWCPNASAIGNGEAKPYYPGPGYVDWVCGDGYNFYPNRPGDKWENFDEIFGPFYREAQKYGKPIMIGEVGVLEDPAVPGRKQQWFHQSHDAIVARYPAIAAVVYFNADSLTNGIHFDWRVGTSPESFEGFRYMFTGDAPIPRPITPTTQPRVVPPVVTTRPPAQPVATTAPKAQPVTPTTRATKATKPTPVKTTAPPPPPKEPSIRLTWVLEQLRHLGS
jgi:endoglucanase